LTQQAGTANTSQSYNASMGYGVWLTGTGSYSKSDGQAIETGAGLVPVPVPTPIIPSSLVSLFGGDSYSFGLSSTPVKKLIIGASYAKSLSNTSTDSITSENQNTELNTLIQYQFRKLNFVSGYARLEQGFSGSGSPPETLVTYYAGISRWFNFF
jgi:predicted porin